MSKKFKRPESWKYKRLGDEWRKPRGAKNPAKRGAAGRPALPSPGHGSPRATRGRHPSGLIDTLVNNLKDMKGLKKGEHIVRIGGSVGKRKRLDIFKKARESGIRVVQNEPESTKKDSK
ncbi:MAG: 50S ribosomal protein L32e [Candidatus Altiarchaeota archaeon]|nr:50S ribosomal protein L32e [Candidatus Altiarchaeota archaeon]